MNYQIGGNHFSVSSKFLLILESSLEKNYDQVWASKYTIITSYAKMKVACSKRFGPPQILLPPTLTIGWSKNPVSSQTDRYHFHAIFKSYLPFQRYSWLYPPKDCRWVKSAVSLKWHIGFENGIKMTHIFTIIFISKMLIWQCITSLEHTFLVNGLSSVYRI